ncbi:MAG: ROK family protein [Nocardioides sp.]
MYVGVDVGGTKVLAVELLEDGRVGRSARRATPRRGARDRDLDAVVDEAITEVAAGRDVTGIGLSVAGLVDPARDLVRFATHLPWVEDPVRSRLAARWGLPVVLDNDANCAAVAELALGVARGVDSFVMVMVGTGIGGAIVEGGQLVRGANGMAGEFGHMKVVHDGLPCPCGLTGCWEQYASGNTLPRLIGDERPDLTDGLAVGAAAESGDRVALAALAEVGDWLGVGIANLVSALDPALVVVGGGVSAVGDLLLDPARVALERSVLGVGHRRLPPIVRARFGPDAGAVGAAYLAADAG